MRRTISLVLVSALLLSAAACTDSDDGDPGAPGTPEAPQQPEQPEQPEQPTTPQPSSSADYDDVAQAIATIVVTGSGGGDAASIADSLWLAQGLRPDGFRVDSEGRVRAERFGLNYQYELVCVDGAGDSLDQCDDRTDSATVYVAWSGQLDTPSFDATIARNGTWTLTGIRSGLATLIGTSSFELNSTFTGLFDAATRAYHLDYAARYSDIQVAVDSKQIISGTAEYTVDAERMASGDGATVEASFAATAVVTFEPGRAIIVLDGQATYHVDTSTGAVTRA